MKFNIAYRILLSNSVTWVLMIVVSYIAFNSITSLNETANWISHTYEVIEHTSGIEKSVLDMETGVRGFVIVGKNNFLKPYENGKAHLSKLLDETELLISDNPQQIRNLKQIENEINLWVKEAGDPEIEKRIEVNQLSSTMDELTALIEKEKGKQIMDDIRDQLKNFKLAEKELLAVRKLAADKEMNFTKTAIIFGTIAIIIFSHMFSLLLADSIAKPAKLLQSTIKDMGHGIFPSKKQIESNYGLAGLEKSFEQIDGRIISKEKSAALQKEEADSL